MYFIDFYGGLTTIPKGNISGYATPHDSWLFDCAESLQIPSNLSYFSLADLLLNLASLSCLGGCYLDHASAVEQMASHVTVVCLDITLYRSHVVTIICKDVLVQTQLGQFHVTCTDNQCSLLNLKTTVFKLSMNISLFYVLS